MISSVGIIGKNFVTDRTREKGKSMKIDTKELGTTILNYHGGQGCPLYSVGSTLYADGELPDDVSIVSEAAEHLDNLAFDTYELGQVFKTLEVAHLAMELWTVIALKSLHLVMELTHSGELPKKGEWYSWVKTSLMLAEELDEEDDSDES